MKLHILIYALVGLLLAACSSNGSADISASATTPPATSPGGIAMSLIAEQMSAPPEQITLLSEEAVDFSDSSLGCPQPGMAYMQVITPGHQVMVEYAGEIYDVRIAGGRAVMCDSVATGTQR